MNFKIINKEDIPQANGGVKGHGKYYNIAQGIVNSGFECVEITDVTPTDGDISVVRTGLDSCLKKHFDGKYKAMQRGGRLFVVRA